MERILSFPRPPFGRLSFTKLLRRSSVPSVRENFRYWMPSSRIPQQKETMCLEKYSPAPAYDRQLNNKIVQKFWKNFLIIFRCPSSFRLSTSPKSTFRAGGVTSLGSALQFVILHFDLMKQFSKVHPQRATHTHLLLQSWLYIGWLYEGCSKNKNPYTI